MFVAPAKSIVVSGVAIRLRVLRSRSCRDQIPEEKTMGTIFTRWRTAALIISMMTVLALVACGDEATTEASANNAAESPAKSELQATAEEPTATTAPTAVAPTPTQIVIAVEPKEVEPPTVDHPVVMIEEPAAGSEEEAVLMALERLISTMNMEDWFSVAESCDPRLIKPQTPEQIETQYVRGWGIFAPTGTISRRNVTIEITDDSNAIVRSDIYSYDEPAFQGLTDSWVKVDEDWYFSNLACHGGNSAIVEAEPEPKPELTQERAEALIAETKGQPVVEFPDSLRWGAEKISPEAVLAKWTEILTGTRTVALSESIVWEYCSDNTGVWVYEVGTPGFTGAKFDWELKNDPGGTWNTAVVVIKMHEQKLYDLLNYAGGDGFRYGLSEPSDANKWQAYVSPDCT